ncbi:MAG: penicillin-binding protein [Oscillospiraceae bacterium]|nr:penicillin-binding protein [Oscillospiraceae bacterium]
MNRVANRSTIALILAVILLGGMCLFAVEYAMNAGNWVIFEGNPHVYTGSNIGCGIIYDRSGVVLLDSSDTRTYADDAAVRKATIHWLGDRYGYISAPAVTAYAGDMAGYDFLNGLYGYSGTGGSAELTISAELQKTALEALGKKKGTVAVYNYKTGEILCAVSTPNYDPDNVPDIDEGSSKYEGIYVNRFTQTSYVPGSVFKLVTAAAALDTLDNAMQIEFRCDGVYEMSGGKVKCTGEHGTIGLKRALQKSCNCYFAQLSEVLGADTLERYVKEFRITEPVRFDGITTAKGSFSVEDASAQQIAWAAIGQHLDTINPCRYMTFMGVIAGGGKAAEPYIVESAGAGVFGGYQASANSTGRLMDEDTAKALGELMRNNVENQYGDDNFPGLTVCAKSGTAEVGGDQKPNATFAGFCADEDYPLAFMVVVEDAGSGAKTCIPIISEVLAACKELLDSE